MGSTVIIMPESDDTTLCLAFTGGVTKEDHYNNLVLPMKERIEKFGYYNLLIWHKDDFNGYEPDAADQSFVSIRDLGPYARRIAYVNPSERKLFQTTLMRVKLGHEVKNFDTKDLAEAIAWAKGG
ncbi:MAG: STAS/SEC14 domain-containing protein [Alphaproteobacteria bacterium]|nr:STAS/SEC14 domain-containing protein [Alphaproteobacteria bacterium]MBU0858533.1 STAS/SEC14 domain-containing protein [Alphaproteobacteria bacterium]